MPDKAIEIAKTFSISFHPHSRALKYSSQILTDNLVLSASTPKSNQLPARNSATANYELTHFVLVILRFGYIRIFLAPKVSTGPGSLQARSCKHDTHTAKHVTREATQQFWADSNPT